MTPNLEQILSASRRTDIPAFYLDWFMDHIQQGVFDVTNPYNRKTRQISVRPDTFHSIVFWSKNFDVFLQNKAGEKLTDLGFHLYFNFTINSESTVLEPGLPPLAQRLTQLTQLSKTFGPQCISWRFDPICFYQTTQNSPEKDNLHDFNTIAGHAADLKIQSCVTSFFDPYRKIVHRLNYINQKKNCSISFTLPDFAKKKAVIQHMAAALALKKMDLRLCCETDLYAHIKEIPNIQENACIDGNRLQSIFRGMPETRRDYGQRSKKGCLCTKSIDIGNYEQHPCFHNCLFCYANPDIDNVIKRTKIQ